MESKACCFIGHRRLQDKETVLLRVRQTVKMLVFEKGVRLFLFGSKSEFDDLCHLAVTELQGVCPDLLRINYPCKSEYAVRKEEKAKQEEGWSRLLKQEVHFKDYDAVRQSERIYNAGKAAYVERNRKMIDDSDFCVFFYTETYQPTPNARRPSSKKSGTLLAYDYALQKKKEIYNLADTATDAQVRSAE